jgi:serine/threonine protein phosphatase PrpC
MMDHIANGTAQAQAATKQQGAMQMEIAVLSEVGGRSANEDSCGHWSADGKWFVVVADGAGGHRGGPIASRLAVNEVLRSLRAKRECNAAAVEAAMKSANEAVVREQKARSRYSNMRTTIVVLAIDSQAARATWGHLGDSRLYCFRDAGIVAQTRDHSVVQTMVDAGYLEPQQVRTSPDRSKLLSALGDEHQFEPAVERGNVTVESGDKFLLCTDGLWEYVQEIEMEKTAGECKSAEEWLQALKRVVLSRAKQKHDNYTAIAVWCT